VAARVKATHPANAFNSGDTILNSVVASSLNIGVPYLTTELSMVSPELK
jgi:hypothetical protein